MLEIVDAIKPAEREQLKKVARELFVKGGTVFLTDGDAIKKKFYSLIPKQKTTGETEVPSVASRALMIRNSIAEHWCAGSVDLCCSIHHNDIFLKNTTPKKYRKKSGRRKALVSKSRIF